MIAVKLVIVEPFSVFVEGNDRMCRGVGRAICAGCIISMTAEVAYGFYFFLYDLDICSAPYSSLIHTLLEASLTHSAELYIPSKN